MLALALPLAISHVLANSIERQNAAIAAGEGERARRSIAAMGLDAMPHAFAHSVALRRGSLVDLFLKAGSNPDATDEAGRTPLFHAVAERDWTLMSRMLAAGAKARLADSGGVSPLMLASAFGQLGPMKELLAAGAEIDGADIDGRTALHYALAAGKTEAAMALMNAGAVTNARDVEGRDALAFAAKTRDWRVIQAVLEPQAGRDWDFPGRSALEQALASKEVARVRLVLTRHNGPPAPEGCTAPLLAYAVAANDLAMAKLLLEAGADPNTVVKRPVEERFLEYIPQKFLRHYLANEDGMTALIVAAGTGHLQMLQLLMEHGAERSRATQSKHRLVPIYFAAWGDHAECIQALISNAPTPDQFRIEIDLGTQSATLYRDGVAAIQTGISSGRAGFTTRTGRFVVTDKKTSHVSSIYKVKMPFFMRLSCSDFGMHVGHVPNYPASHGCIRLPEDAAKKFFREVPLGTLVTITP